MVPGADTFYCATCYQYRYVELLCRDASTLDGLSCVRCCACPQHGDPDPGGRAVFALTHGRLTWRGLHTSEHRTRRHT
jgi:hypothetical protein